MLDGAGSASGIDFPLFILEADGEKGGKFGRARVDEPRTDYQGGERRIRSGRLIRNQDRKIPGFRSHRTGQLFSSLFAERPINLDPVVRIVCAATKALTLTRSFRRSSTPDGWFFPFLHHRSHRAGPRSPLARAPARAPNKTRI